MRFITVTALIFGLLFFVLQLLPLENMGENEQNIVIFGSGSLLILAGMGAAFANYWNRNKRGNTP